MKSKKIIRGIIVILLIIVFVFLFKNKILVMIYPKTYEEAVNIYHEKYEIEQNLIFAVIKAESNFDKEAMSSRDAIGLMQVLPETAEEVVRKNQIELDLQNIEKELLDPYKNIEIGTCYLAMLMERYQNKEVALAAYNAGSGRVDGWIEKGIIKKDGTDIENIPFKETNNYVRKILRDYKIYEDLYKN